MILLQSRCFREREDLCEFVNSKNGYLEIVSIVNMSSNFVLFYRDNSEDVDGSGDGNTKSDS